MEREKFPSEIKEVKYLIERKAKRAGLDFPLVIFEVVDFEEMNCLAATGGFPVRWSHWIHGQEFERMRKFYKYGLSIIYEMVINTDPAYAYLLSSNTITDHKMVIAHVYGHCDFFKNNIWLSHLNPKMVDEIADHAIRVERYKEEQGSETVEEFIDDCLSINYLIDIYAPHIKRERKERDEVPKEPKRVSIPEGKGYLEEFLNPIEWLEKQRDELKKREEIEKAVQKGVKIPIEPVRDILGFWIQYAPLEQWQRDVLAILREEAYYFAPQGQTQIMNEGWASYWHSKIMTELGVAETKEIIDYALNSAGAWARRPGSINPYKLGLELWRDIEWRWDTGRHGPIYENCHLQDILENWDEFAVFKVLHQDLLLEKNWDEWCAFKEALSKGEFGFPKEAWDKKKAVKWWCDYQRLGQILKRLSRERADLRKKIKNTQDILARLQDGEEIRRYHSEKSIFESELEDVQVEIKFYRSFVRFKTAFQMRKVAFKQKPIPESYLTYADQYKGEKVEIGKGLEKIFEVRTYYNDINFISEFFTDEFCKKRKYYSFEPGGGGVPPDHYGIESIDPKEVRQKILFMITNLGKPIIYLNDANYQGKGEIYLKHLNEGIDLKIDYMKAVLEILYKYWQKKVYLETVITQEGEKTDPYAWLRRSVSYDPYAHPEEGKKELLKGEKKVFSFDGTQHEVKKLEDMEVRSPFKTGR
jgi:stage V sporulation protein R